MSLHILSLETSSAWCGVALLCASDAAALSTASSTASSSSRVILREHQGVQEHSARLLPMIDEVLAEAGIARTAIDAIAFGQGPGGFTGLRVACGVAQGIGFALDRPLLPIVSHAAVAAQVQAPPGQPVVVAMDARMQEVYVAAYLQPNANEQIAVLEPQLMALEGLEAWLRASLPAPWLLAGDGAAAYPEAFAGVPLSDRAEATRPTAAAVATLAWRGWLRGEAIAPELAMPLYVRDKVAFTTAERLLGSGGNPRVAPAASVPESAAGDAA